MKCKNCGTHNSDQALKCVNCNAPMDGSMVVERPSTSDSAKGNVICKNCKATNAADALKCHQCNAPLDGSMVVDQNNKAGLGSAQVICKNCKSTNPADALKCLKCNAPLDGSLVIKAPEVAKHQKIDKSTTAIHLKSPVAGNVCPHCGYPNQDIATECVKCSAVLTKSNSPAKSAAPSPIPPVSDRKAMDMTINPYAALPVNPKGFSLTPLKGDLSEDRDPIRLEAEVNKLDRAMLDADNNTITSTGQATIRRKDNKWVIEDNSAMQTTFLKVSGTMDLNDGDIILMGNKMFRFTAQ